MSGIIESQLRYHANYPDTPSLVRHWALKALEELKYRAEVIEQRNAEIARGHADFMQAITDPENQPSQFGTVTLAMYEALEARLPQPEQVPDYREIANCVLAGLEDRKGVLKLDVDADIEEEIRQEVADNIRMMLSAAPSTKEQSND